MKYDLKINTYPVLMVAQRDSDKLVLLRKEYTGSDHVEFIVTATPDGQTYGDSSYFHSADYGGEEAALLAAKLRFLYRAGFTSTFDRISEKTGPWAWKGMDDLHLAHKKRNDARQPMYAAVRQVVMQMKTGEWMDFSVLNQKRLAIQGIEHFATENPVVVGIEGVIYHCKHHLEPEGLIKVDTDADEDGMGVTRL